MDILFVVNSFPVSYRVREEGNGNVITLLSLSLFLLNLPNHILHGVRKQIVEIFNISERDATCSVRIKLYACFKLPTRR